MWSYSFKKFQNEEDNRHAAAWQNISFSYADSPKDDSSPVADEELNPNPHVWIYCIDGHALLYSISLFSLLVRRGRGGGIWKGKGRGLKKEAHRKMDRFWVFWNTTKNIKLRFKDSRVEAVKSCFFLFLLFRSLNRWARRLVLLYFLFVFLSFL